MTTQKIATAELAKRVAQRAGITHRQAHKITLALIQETVASLTQGQTVTLTGLATFIPQAVPARKGVNPATGTPTFHGPSARIKTVISKEKVLIPLREKMRGEAGSEAFLLETD